MRIVKCDFCGSRGARYQYPCQDFEVTSPDGEVMAMSRGPWAACVRCAKYVEQRHFADLAACIGNEENRRRIGDKENPTRNYRSSLEKGVSVEFERHQFRLHVWFLFDANRIKQQGVRSIY